MPVIRIAHVIPGLQVGGAELMLTRLVHGMDTVRFSNTVISLTGSGPAAEVLESRGIRVQTLGMGRIPTPKAIARLFSWLRAESPDVVQTWLYAADFLGGLAGTLAGANAIVWNLRQLAPVQPHFAPRHVWAARACGLLSTRVPTAVVCCSEEVRRSHEALGYVRGRYAVIPNGFDLEVFGPGRAAYTSVRAELGVDTDTALIGMVARFDPVKGHADFFKAATLISRTNLNAHFLLSGEGMAATNDAVASKVNAPELQGRVHLLGRRNDVPRLLAALDVAVSASHSEGFPNTVGEAMASAVPCVATDVGGTASLVGEAGSLVPPHEPAVLASAVLSILGLGPAERSKLGEAARRRIERLYSLQAMIDQYSRLYESLVRVTRPQPTMCRA